MRRRHYCLWSVLSGYVAETSTDDHRREQAFQELADGIEFEMIENPMAAARPPTYMNGDGGSASNTRTRTSTSTSTSISTSTSNPSQQVGAAMYSEPNENAELYALPAKRSGVAEVAAMNAALDESNATLYTAAAGVAGTPAGGGMTAHSDNVGGSQASGPSAASLSVYQNVQQLATRSSSSAYENVDQLPNLTGNSSA